MVPASPWARLGAILGGSWASWARLGAKLAPKAGPRATKTRQKNRSSIERNLGSIFGGMLDHFGSRWALCLTLLGSFLSLCQFCFGSSWFQSAPSLLLIHPPSRRPINSRSLSTLALRNARSDSIHKTCFVEVSQARHSVSHA